MSSKREPTPPSERIVSIDVLRGFALLGILLINVWVFAMPEVTLSNPRVYGDFSGDNYAAWLGSHVLAEGKMISIFTLLFGAGVLLFTENKPGDAVGLFQRRNAWLLAIGLAHAYLLWYGDILVTYALCRSAVVYIREWPARSQIGVGIALLAIISVSELAVAVSAGEDAIRAQWEPTAAAIQSEVETYRSGWLAQMDHRVPTSFRRQTSGFIGYSAWRVGGLMAIGMGLYKSGVLTNERSAQEYRRLALASGTAGFAMVLAGVWYITAADWGAGAALYFRQFNHWGSLLVALCYVAGVMLFCRRWGDGIVAGALAAVGRTALSNYLLQTVLATSIFYGHGLGLFGSVSRVEMLGVVGTIWAVQIPLSALWLRYFRFGPIEWLWRTATYGEPQPLRK